MTDQIGQRLESGLQQGVEPTDGQGRDSQQLATLTILLKDQDRAIRVQELLRKLSEGEFGQSKARDSNGELAITWHGSSRVFDEFDPIKRGEYRWRNEGVHFSGSKDFVNQYANKAILSFRVAFSDIGREVVGKGYNPENPEHLRTATEAYNKLIEDLIQNGEQSPYYQDHGTWSSVQYERRSMDMDWFGEIFGGGLPTKDSAVMVKGPGGAPVYFGKDIGRVYYACVLNMRNPYVAETSTDRDVDFSFEAGEESHRSIGTDGTILTHIVNETVSPEGKFGQKAANYTHYAVFDPKQIRIIGREVNGVFQLMPEFSE